MSLSGEQMTMPSTVRIVPPARDGGRDRIVGLEGDHRPEGDAERLDRRLRDRKLAHQRRVDAGPRLVARIQVVAERFDDPVGRRGEVGRPLVAQDRQQVLDQAPGRGQVAPVGGQHGGPGCVERPEQLVGRVDEMELHRGFTAQPAGFVPCPFVTTATGSIGRVASVPSVGRCRRRRPSVADVGLDQRLEPGEIRLEDPLEDRALDHRAEGRQDRWDERLGPVRPGSAGRRRACPG